jgi:hypothetical protein
MLTGEDKNIPQGKENKAKAADDLLVVNQG